MQVTWFCWAANEEGGHRELKTRALEREGDIPSRLVIDRLLYGPRLYIIVIELTVSVR